MSSSRVLGASALLAATCLSCATLLGLRDRQEWRPFEHRAHLNQGVGCYDCHAGIGTAEDDGPLHLPSDQRCLECHPKPHDTRSCRGCHGSPFTEERAAASKHHLRFSHQEHSPRVDDNCARCHQMEVDAEELLPPMGACLSCHQHQREFEVRSCETCHHDLQAESVRPKSHVVHAEDYQRRHAIDASSARDLCQSCHAESFCAGCHGATVSELAGQRAFEPNFNRRLHRAGFRSRHAEEARALPGTCTSCHSIDSCASCHQREEVGAIGALRRGPHPEGWVGVAQNDHGRAARIDPMSCAACHSGAGEQLCVGCHKVGGIGGSLHPPGWSSNKRLSEAPCRLCHLGGAL